MNLPNLISLVRLLSVPLTVWLMLSGHWLTAFAIFIAAGISDAIDGFIARQFNLRTELGGILDPLADKALLVSIYITLGVQGHLPAWLVILVVSRDLLIVGWVLLAFALDLNQSIRPLFISKANTVAQIVLAGVVLGDLAALDVPPAAIELLAYAVGATTLFSGASYLLQWARSTPQQRT